MNNVGVPNTSMAKRYCNVRYASTSKIKVE